MRAGNILCCVLCRDLPPCCFLKKYLVKGHIHFEPLFRARCFFGWDADLTFAELEVAPLQRGMYNPNHVWKEGGIKIIL